MHANRRPNLQPLSMLPMLACVVDEQLADLEKQLAAIQRAHERTGSMDDATIDHVLRVFGETKQLLPTYELQVDHWRTSCSPSVVQASQIAHLAEQLTISIKVVNEILKLADEIKGQTIEALMGIGDLAWGLAALGAHPPKDGP